MCNPDFFEQFLGFGNAGESLTFNYLTLSAFKVDPAPLARLGLLRERTIGSRIECAGCGVFAPISPRMEEDGKRFTPTAPNADGIGFRLWNPSSGRLILLHYWRRRGRR